MWSSVFLFSATLAIVCVSICACMGVCVCVCVQARTPMQKKVLRGADLPHQVRSISSDISIHTTFLTLSVFYSPHSSCLLTTSITIPSPTPLRLPPYTASRHPRSPPAASYPLAAAPCSGTDVSHTYATHTHTHTCHGSRCITTAT